MYSLKKHLWLNHNHNTIHKTLKGLLVKIISVCVCVLAQYIINKHIML